MQMNLPKPLYPFLGILHSVIEEWWDKYHDITFLFVNFSKNCGLP